MKNLTYLEKNIHQTAKEIISAATTKCLAFYAPMGAGKTTLIKALVAELGSMDTVSSPTFGLVNEYHDANGAVLAYHFDFYRLEDEMEAMDMGLEEYLNAEPWVFMEWPEKIPSLLPRDTTKIEIEILSPTERRISF